MIEEYGNCIECGKPLTQDEYETDTGVLCKECSNVILNRDWEVIFNASL
jgi:DNA-directed RNA polymerase subunit RPC12/RpoP